MMGRIWTVARRELAGYFDHATAYILLVIFLGINFYFYFQDAYLIGEASLRPMLSLFPWLLLFFVPAVCMRSFAEERNAGTLELVLAQPVEVIEFVIGKFLGVILFMMIAMAGTLGVPLGLTLGADLQWGVIFSQYAGSIFLIGALVAVGMWASSLTRNQVTAFILGVTTSFALYLVGLPAVVLALPAPLAGIASRLGILGHVTNVARGVIDLRDVLYFAAVMAAFLSLTYFSVMRERLSPRRNAYARLRLGALGLVGISIFTALAAGVLRARLDLTPGRVYTLSEPTADLLEGLDDIVTIRLFRSSELPPELTPVGRDVDDLLADIDAAGGSNINLVEVDPADDQDVAGEASRLGVSPVRFQVLGEDEMSVRDGYFGLAVQYAGESDVIPVIQRTNDLEYRLATMVRGLTREDRRTVGVLQGDGQLVLESEMALVRNRLGETYHVVEVSPETVTPEAPEAGDAADEMTAVPEMVLTIPDEVDVLMIAGGRTPLSSGTGRAVSEWVDDGGSLLLLRAGFQPDMRSMYAGPSFDPVTDSLLEARNLGVIPSMLADLALNEAVQVPSRFGSIIVGYPLWMLAQPSSGHVIVDGVSNVPFRYASPLQVDLEDTTRVTPLLMTSEFTGRANLPGSVDPNQDWQSMFTQEDVGTETLAVAWSDPEGGRIVLAGTQAIVEDAALQGSHTGMASMIFLENAVDWLAEDESLISIRSKNRAPPPLLFPSDLVRDLVKYLNLAGVPILFVFLGVLRLARRRKAEQREFQPGGALV